MSDFDKDKEKLSAENQEAWDEFAREGENTQPEEENFEELLDQFEEPTKENKQKNSFEPVVKKETERTAIDNVKKLFYPPQLDRRTLEKLRKGKMLVEARIDLHGMTREIAHEALEKFILRCARDNLRHVLVITGKGKSKSSSAEWLTPEQGILKTNVPYWLDGASLKPYILKYMHAQPKDGGSGALYVYLKRKR